MIKKIKLATIGEKQTIHNLFQPYLEELVSVFNESPEYKDENGVYHYPYLDNYWQEETRYPYLLYSDDRIVGFVLVGHRRTFWVIAEIYVLPEFRRHGVAFDCSKEIIQRHPGEWEISFNKHNAASRSLWEKLAEHLSNGTISVGEIDSSYDYIRFSI